MLFRRSLTVNGGNLSGGAELIRSTENTQWRRSSRCGGGACVEVAKIDGFYHVRDAKDPNGAVLTFSADEWAAFVAGAKASEFDI